MIVARGKETLPQVSDGRLLGSAESGHSVADAEQVKAEGRKSLRPKLEAGVSLLYTALGEG